MRRLNNHNRIGRGGVTSKMGLMTPVRLLHFRLLSGKNTFAE